MTRSQIEKYIELNFKTGTEFISFGSKKKIMFKKLYYVKDDGRVYCRGMDNSDYCIRNYEGRWAEIINP